MIAFNENIQIMYIIIHQPISIDKRTHSTDLVASSLIRHCFAIENFVAVHFWLAFCKFPTCRH